jgi:hypothetical protein
MTAIYRGNKNVLRLSTESERMNIETAKSSAWQFSTTATQKNKYTD